MGGKLQLKGPDLRTEGAAIGKLEEGRPVSGHADGEPVVLVRQGSAIRALGGKCTHYGGPLADGIVTDGTLRCPWHHARFALTTGEAVGCPALNPVPVWRAEEREGRIFVTGKEPEPIPPRRPRRSPESVVLLGAGAAGAAAAETLRREGYGGPITLVGDEPPVDRPNLSKDYLAGTAPEEWVSLRGASFYAERGIDLVTGTRIASIDRVAQRVHLEGGAELEYATLLYAPGAEPLRLPFPGADRPHAFTLRSLADSRAIIAAAGTAKRAVLIGAGFIGLEVAASLRQRDVEVTIVAPEELPLGRIVGEHLGHFVQGIHEEHGVAFRLGRTVAEIGAHSVTLDDGTELDADLVVVGVGVRPRTALAEAAGLEVDEGVVVDDRLATSDPAIWAAGDVASFPWGDRRVRIEHWVVAQRQGQCAARNMLGADRPYREAPFFWSQHYDVAINYVGHAVDWDEEVVRGLASDHDVAVALRKDGRIDAVVSIYRDVESLRAEAAMESGDTAALEALFTSTSSG